MPPHVSYVSTLHDITQKSNTYAVFLLVLVVWVALQRTGFDGSVPSEVPLSLHVHAAVFATGQWLRRWCTEEYGPGISRAKFYCNRLTTVQDIQDYASLIFRHTEYLLARVTLTFNGLPGQAEVHNYAFK